jgi:hypothetical protein
MCRCFSGVVWQRVQIGFACPLNLKMRSDVGNLDCRSSHEKNLHLFSTLARQMIFHWPSLIAPTNCTLFRSATTSGFGASGTPAFGASATRHRPSTQHLHALALASWRPRCSSWWNSRGGHTSWHRESAAIVVLVLTEVIKIEAHNVVKCLV